jgi:hypothetical protein
LITTGKLIAGAVAVEDALALNGNGVGEVRERVGKRKFGFQNVAFGLFRGNSEDFREIRQQALAIHVANLAWIALLLDHPLALRIRRTATASATRL